MKTFFFNQNVKHFHTLQLPYPSSHIPLPSSFLLSTFPSIIPQPLFTDDSHPTSPLFSSHIIYPCNAIAKSTPTPSISFTSNFILTPITLFYTISPKTPPPSFAYRFADLQTLKIPSPTN